MAYECDGIDRIYEWFLNYQKNQSEQKENIFFSERLGEIVCHWPEFSLALVDEANGWIKSQKRSWVDEKCTLFIPFKKMWKNLNSTIDN